MIRSYFSLLIFNVYLAALSSSLFPVYHRAAAGHYLCCRILVHQFQASVDQSDTFVFHEGNSTNVLA